MSDPTNAERQARHRAKRKAELRALRNGKAKLQTEIRRLEAENKKLRRR